MSRPRATDHDRTVRRSIDVAAAFGSDEHPTRPAVSPLVPLDAVPVLAGSRTEVPWEDLSALATQLLRRVDGRARAMEIVTGNAGNPRECASELAALARRGLLRLLPGIPDEVGIPLEIDLSML
ncbi:MAG TPA: hypothetical protein VHS09_04435 [Polyangiaceae bacterium]|nr:hypothetical protein [Polyangiaceae bacterium]